MSAQGAASFLFPSVEWFQQLQESVNSDPEFRRLGNVDAVMGVKVGDQVFIITFEAFQLHRRQGGNGVRPHRRRLLPGNVPGAMAGVGDQHPGK